jgi:hypothetical protein
VEISISDIICLAKVGNYYFRKTMHPPLNKGVVSPTHH